MNTTLFTLHRARHLAASIRTRRTATPTWDVPVDRDQARLAHDLAYLTATSAPRVL